jgi:hypothetical protein
LQVLSGQHGSLGPPQVTQRPVMPQMAPAAEHTPLLRPVLGSMVPGLFEARAQQGSPTPPQRAQTLPAQAVPGAVQVEAQQVCPRPPQPPHEPAAQVPSTGAQVPPAATHFPLTQHPPALQVFPAQQAPPGPPQSSAGVGAGPVSLVPLPSSPGLGVSLETSPPTSEPVSLTAGRSGAAPSPAVAASEAGLSSLSSQAVSIAMVESRAARANIREGTRMRGILHEAYAGLQESGARTVSLAPATRILRELRRVQQRPV